jgi:lysophospholipase L1-like esterase
LAALELVAAVYVVSHNVAPKSAPSSAAARAQPPDTTKRQTPSLGVAATSAAPGGSARTVVAFLGDDWTAGIGASAEGKRFTTLVCRRLHVRERNFGADLTGYAKSSDAGGPYGSRIAGVVAAHPQVVVVSGGRNDRSDNVETFATQVHDLFARLHERLPDAVLLAVAPFWGDSDLPPELGPLAKAVEQAVRDAGGTYLDLPDPIHDHPEFMADAGDPNDRGYAAIAAALEPALRPLLPR